MIDNIEITNYRGDSITLKLKNPEESGFFIKKVDGLAPPKATINIDEQLAGGGYYNSSRVLTRNIILDLGFYNLTAGLSIEQIRFLSYKYFPVNTPVSLTITTDSLVATSIGYVEDNDVYIFSSEEGTVLSIVCPDEFMVGADLFEIPIIGVEGAFEFPLENEGLSPAIVLGYLYEEQHTAYINYSGTYETGVIFTVSFSGSVTDPFFKETLRNQSLTLNSQKVTAITGENFKSGDVVVISTKKNQKYATLIRNSVEYDILAALFVNGTIDWITLIPGDNYIQYGATSGDANMSATCTFNLLYGGV